MKSFSILILSVVVFAFGSCKKFVEVDTPYTQNSAATAFSDGSSATAAIVGVYTNIVTKQISYYTARRTGAYGDELVNYDGYSDISKQLYTNALNPSTFNSLWTDSYSIIYQLNAAVEGLNNSTALNAAVKNQLLGEAKFTRAFMYFYLVNLYGDVPYINETDYKQTGIAANTPAADIYTYMIEDCKSADSLLNENYVDATSINTSFDRIRPNKFAAEALLARLYLYNGDYADAATMATSIINNSQYALTDLNSVFLQNSTEAIWQLQKITQTQFYSDGANFILQYYISTFGENNSSALSQQLLNTFETGDNRKTNWVGVYTDFDGTNYYYPYKYKESYVFDPTPITENTMVLRLGEQYLIRAEAQAQQDNTTAAIADLNTIRSRAGLSDYAGSTDKASVVTAVLHEKQVELFTEWGSRWFDLKRSGTADAVMASVAPLKGGTWSAYKKLWCIPQSDLDKDVNLKQNEGY